MVVVGRSGGGWRMVGVYSNMLQERYMVRTHCPIQGRKAQGGANN